MRWLRFWRLSRGLQSPAWEARVRAVRGLGELGHPRTLGLLTEAINDPHVQVRQSAFAALIGLGPAAIEPFVGMMRSDDLDLRETGVAGLVQLGPASVDTLVKVLREERGEVRHAAIRALGCMKDVRAVPALQDALTDYDYVVRKLAVGALAKMWQPTIEPLVASLKDWNSHVRASAAEALGQVGDGRVVEPLVRALKDKEENVRLAARDALVRLADPRAVRMLLDATGELSSDVAGVVGDVLAAVGKKNLEALRPALECENAGVRMMAARVVAQCGKKKAVEYLLPLLEDAAVMVRKTAAEALFGLGWKPENGIQRACCAVATGKWDEAVAEGEAAVGPLLGALEEVSRTNRKAAVEALGRIGHQRAVGALLRRLGDTFDDIRAAAAEALGRIGDAQAAEPVMERLADACADVRRQACVAVGQIGDERAVGPLTRLLRDEDEAVRKAAAEALESLTAESRT